MAELEIMKDVFYVGYIDWEIRNFHGYTTNRGSSYNAYIAKGEKTVLIDTVKEDYSKHYIENIKKVTPLEKIDYLIINHVEPDHSGAFPEIVKLLPNAQIIASKKGVEILEQHYHDKCEGELFKKIKAVDNGDSIDIGNGRKITFVPIPMIHWPDSMVSFMTDDNGKNVLFSNDAFGQHYATSLRWDDENDLSEIMWEAEKYYANILLHLSTLIAKTLPVVGALPIDIVCPSHGICWRKNVSLIVEKYVQWSSGKTDDNTVLIIYDTMWKSTEKIAKALYKEISSRSIPVRRFKLSNSDNTDIITEAMSAKAVLIGSPTLNYGLFPSVAEYLSYQKGLKLRGKIGLAFGSYGWSGGAVKAIIEEMKAAGMDVMDEKIEIQFVPKPEQLNFKEIVDKLIEKMRGS